MAEQSVEVIEQVTTLTVTVSQNSVSSVTGATEVTVADQPVVVEVTETPVSTLVDVPTPSVIEVSTPGPQGPQGPSEEEVAFDTEVDESTPGVVYVGQAAPGTAPATAGWRIKRITEGTGTTTVDWAEGTAEYDKQWTLRATYTYGP